MVRELGRRMCHDMYVRRPVCAKLVCAMLLSHLQTTPLEVLTEDLELHLDDSDDDDDVLRVQLAGFSTCGSLKAAVSAFCWLKSAQTKSRCEPR